jgi:hypothetical protein
MTEQRDDLAGDLATVTDDEWRAAHDRLFRDLVDTIGGTEEMDRAAPQFDYQWTPGQPYREGPTVTWAVEPGNRTVTIAWPDSQDWPVPPMEQREWWEEGDRG